MRVPDGPHSLKHRVVSSNKTSDEDETAELKKPPKPEESSKARKDHRRRPPPHRRLENNNANNMILDNVVLVDGVASGAGFGYHRSRERTRRSAVLKLLERKQKEKQREKDRNNSRSCRRARSDSVGSSSNVSQKRNREVNKAAALEQKEAVVRVRSFSASADSFEGHHQHLSEKRYRGAATNAEVLTKTYISIGPGKPTRIRESSPSKSPTTLFRPENSSNNIRPSESSPAFSTDWTIKEELVQEQERSRDCSPVKKEACARGDQDTLKVSCSIRNSVSSPCFSASWTIRKEAQASRPQDRARSRDSSPSKRSDTFLQTASPLKTAGLLKDLKDFKGGSASFNPSSIGPTRKRSFTTERTIYIGPADNSGGRSSSSNNTDISWRVRRLSAEVYSKTSSSSSSTRSSAERDFSTVRPNSSRSSSFSSSTSSLSSDNPGDGSNKEEVLSKRRISLENRFKARASNSNLDNIIDEYKDKEEEGRKNGSTSSSRPVSNASSEDSQSSGFSSASSRLLYNLSSGYRYHRAAAAAAHGLGGLRPAAFQRERRFSQDHSSTSSLGSGNGGGNGSHLHQSRSTRPVPRKISLPPTCYEDPERRRWDEKLGDGGGDGDEHDSFSQGELLHESPSFLSLPSPYHFPCISGQEDSHEEEIELFCQADIEGYDMAMSSSSETLKAGKGTRRRRTADVSPDSDLFSSDSAQSCYNREAQRRSWESGIVMVPPPVPVRSHSLYLREKLECRGHNSSSNAQSKLSLMRRNFLNSSQQQQLQHQQSLEHLNDDAHSVSTVSGSGIDFFRKFVQRKSKKRVGGGTYGKSQEHQEYDDAKFRREVLIDRLVADSLQGVAAGGQTCDERSWKSDANAANANCCGDYESSDYCTSSVTSLTELEDKNSGTLLAPDCGQGSCHFVTEDEEDEQSVSARTLSTVSGSGLRFLRNYLKKKASATAGTTKVFEDNNASAAGGEFFNSIPVPFPPVNEFYGPAYPSSYCSSATQLLSHDSQLRPEELEDLFEDRYDLEEDEDDEDKRQSMGSTIADLLNENFDSEDDSELKNLDWDHEWDEDSSVLPCPENLADAIEKDRHEKEGDRTVVKELEEEEDNDGRMTVVQSTEEDEIPTFESVRLSLARQLSHGPGLTEEEGGGNGSAGGGANVEERELAARAQNNSAALTTVQEKVEKGGNKFVYGAAAHHPAYSPLMSSGGKKEASKNGVERMRQQRHGCPSVITPTLSPKESDPVTRYANSQRRNISSSIKSNFCELAAVTVSPSASASSEASTGLLWSRIVSSSSSKLSGDASATSASNSLNDLSAISAANRRRRKQERLSLCSEDDDERQPDMRRNAANDDCFKYYYCCPPPPAPAPPPPPPRSSISLRNCNNSNGEKSSHLSSSLKEGVTLEDHYTVIKSSRLAGLWRDSRKRPEEETFKSYRRSISDGSRSLADFWAEEEVALESSFQPAASSYPDKEGQAIHDFLSVTREAVERRRKRSGSYANFT